MKTYIDDKVNLTGIAPLELAEIFEAPPSDLWLKHEDCNLVWVPCAGVLYARDCDDENLDIDIFVDGNFAEIIRDYYEDTSELVTMFRNMFELNLELKNIYVSDDFDNHQIMLSDLVNELDGITITEYDSEEKLRGGILFSKHTLWMNQAPSWNFELGEDELLAKALELGYVKKVGDDIYLVNNDYEPQKDK